jgi:hypothetical protein
MAVRKPILETLQGYYDFGETYNIVSPYQTQNARVALTEVHESTHHWVCSATSFGHFQKLLAILSRDEGVPSGLRSSMWSAVTETTAVSWFAHEGVATAAELVQAIMSGELQYFESSLPPRYRKAVEPLWIALHLAELPIFVAPPFVNGIALAVFNTTILGDLNAPSSIVDADFRQYFASDDRSPDKRLEMIGAQFRDVVFASRVKAELWRCAHSTFAGCADAAEMLVAYRSLTLVDRFNVNDTFAAQTYSLIEECFRDKLTFVDPASVPTLAGAFVNRWGAWFEETDVKLRRPIEFVDYSGDADRRYEMALRMNYVSAIQETVCVNLQYGLFVRELLKLDSLYIWWWFNGLNERVPMDERGFAIEPDGGYVRVHEIMRGQKFLGFRCPVPRSELEKLGIDSGVHPCAAAIPAVAVNEVLQCLSHTGAVLAMDEITWKVLEKKGYSASLSGRSNPIFLTPSSTEYLYWDDMITSESLKGPVAVFSTPLFDREKTAVLERALVVAAADGLVRAASASSRVIDRVVEKWSVVTSAEILSKFQNNEAWAKSLEVFVYHLASCGF